MDLKIYSISMWTDELNRRFGKTNFSYEKVNVGGNLNVYLNTRQSNRVLVGSYDITNNIGYVHDRRDSIRQKSGSEIRIKTDTNLWKIVDYIPGKDIGY